MFGIALPHLTITIVSDQIKDTYLAYWENNRLYFFNSSKKLLFKSGTVYVSDTDLYSHFTYVILTTIFGNIVSTTNFSASFSLFLEKNSVSYATKITVPTQYNDIFAQMMNYLYIQSDARCNK